MGSEPGATARIPLIAGNWKMNKTNDEAVQLVRELLVGLYPAPPCEVVLCPPSTALTEVSLLLSGTSIRLGGQNLHWERSGALTGEVSGPMLVSAGCSHVIVGHSERRRLFGESDEIVARKTGAALASGLVPIVCVGETLEEREQGATSAVVERQVRAALFERAPETLERVTVAYEPVWAIGTGRNASPKQAQEVHASIRGLLVERFRDAARAVRILYGGSVTPENAALLLAEPDVDGALVGGASLAASTFLPIIRATSVSGAGRAR